MIIKILDSSMIVDFLGLDFDSSKIRTSLEFEANKRADKIISTDLQDWSLRFVFVYTNGTQLLVSKRTKSDPFIKSKDIVAQVPIPTKDKISWGVDLSQHVYKDEGHLNKIIHNFYCLKVDFAKYKNRHDYITDTMRRVVKFSFENGFTINGVKIRLENL